MIIEKIVLSPSISNQEVLTLDFTAPVSDKRKGSFLVRDFSIGVIEYIKYYVFLQGFLCHLSTIDISNQSSIGGVSFDDNLKDLTICFTTIHYLKITFLLSDDVRHMYTCYVSKTGFSNQELRVQKDNNWSIIAADNSEKPTVLRELVAVWRGMYYVTIDTFPIREGRDLVTTSQILSMRNPIIIDTVMRLSSAKGAAFSRKLTGICRYFGIQINEIHPDEEGYGIRMSLGKGNNFDNLRLCQLREVDLYRFILCCYIAAALTDRVTLFFIADYNSDPDITMESALHGRTSFVTILNHDILRKLIEISGAKTNDYDSRFAIFTSSMDMPDAINQLV